MQRGWISHAFRTSSSYYFACLMASTSAWAGEASRAPAGQLPDGTAVEAITLSNDHGVSAMGVQRRGHGNYLIFYRVEVEKVVVIHILHGAQDYGTILFPD